MVDRWQSTAKLPENDPERHVSGAEALEILAEQYGVSHGTVAKARELFETGILTPPRPAADPVSLIPEPPRDKTPAGFIGVESGAESGDETKGKPGVVNLNASIPTVGPKPVEGTKKPAAGTKGKAPAPKGGKPEGVKRGQKGQPAGAKQLVPATPPTSATDTPPATEPPPG
jgi:hypothetical protein